MKQIPFLFRSALEQQIEEQYQEIVRYRKLKNDAIDPGKRTGYAEEIALRQTNIEEIEAEVLEKMQKQDTQISKDELLSAIEDVKNSVIARIDLLDQHLTPILLSINEKEIEKNPEEKQQAEALLQSILARLEQLAPEKKREIGENLNGELSTGAKLKMVIKLGIFQYEQDLLAFTAKEPVKNWKDLWKALLKKKTPA